MMYGLGALCAALAAAVLALAVKIHLLRRSAEEIRREFSLRLETDTNTLLSIPSRDRAMCQLAADINSQLRLLRRERRRYQQGDQELKDAVTGVSHDLRTPLTAICGYLDLLEREEKSPEAERYLSLVRDRTEHLKALTEELLRYSVVLSARTEPPAQEVSLNRALEDSLAAWYAALTERGVAPVVSLPAEPVVRRLDGSSLSRVFSNILSNAIKYSAGDLRVTLAGDGTITFSNTAPGMTPVLAQKLFDRFFTVETGGNSTGLGLSIARHLTVQMGGTVSAACENGVLTVKLHFPEAE